jgi:hypothetical protein
MITFPGEGKRVIMIQSHIWPSGGKMKKLSCVPAILKALGQPFSPRGGALGNVSQDLLDLASDCV